MARVAPAVTAPGGSTSSSITPRPRDSVRNRGRSRVLERGSVGAGVIALFGGADADGDGRSGGIVEDGGTGVSATVAVAAEDDLVSAAPVSEVRGTAEEDHSAKKSCIPVR